MGGWGGGGGEREISKREVELQYNAGKYLNATILRYTAL